MTTSDTTSTRPTETQRQPRTGDARRKTTRDAWSRETFCYCDVGNNRAHYPSRVCY